MLLFVRSHFLTEHGQVQLHLLIEFPSGGEAGKLHDYRFNDEVGNSFFPETAGEGMA